MTLVDELVQVQIPMPEVKRGINKLLNLLHSTILEFKYYPPRNESFLGVCQENNRFMLQRLNEIKPIIKEINRNPDSMESKRTVTDKLTELNKFSNYYLIKENLLFPVIEKHIPEFRCLSVMWSFHDDIRRNLKRSITLLQNNYFDLKVFNQLMGDLFFNMNAIKFREERILYPFVSEKIPEKDLDALFVESTDIEFPFYHPKIKTEKIQSTKLEEGLINLENGYLTLEQIKLIFNHLPVDITFVDEFDKVQYFSTPKKRIFPRTNAIIGRDVHNCHPKESVHVVEKIVESFRTGEKDRADFWIKMKDKFILIQYFAVRDNAGNYKGVIEVSQEISTIQSLEGEKRLLDW